MLELLVDERAIRAPRSRRADGGIARAMATRRNAEIAVEDRSLATCATYRWLGYSSLS